MGAKAKEDSMIEPFAALEQCLTNEIRFLKRAVAQAAEEAMVVGQSGRCRSVDLTKPLTILDEARRTAEEMAARAWMQGPSGSRERIRALHCKELRQKSRRSVGTTGPASRGAGPYAHRGSISPGEAGFHRARGGTDV
jgi:hypothetical protein